jgi:cytochrome c-type biogenesis protein CcmH
MPVFILTAAALIGVALLFLLAPLMEWPRRRPDLAKDSAQGLVEVFRDQILEVESDARAGTLAGERLPEARRELEQRMLSELSGYSRAQTPRARRSLKTAIGVLALLPLAAGLLYWILGNPAALVVTTGPGIVQAGAHATSADQIAAMVERLEVKLQQDPRNVDGWAMLARSLVVLERYGEALAAFAKAEELVPGDAALLADYADAVAMTQNGRLAGKPMQLVRRALAADPANAKALALAGTEAFDRRAYYRAAQLWEQALRTTPPGSEFSDALRASLAEARSLAGMPAAVANVDDPAGKQGIGQVSGRITVSAELRSKIPSGGTLFIYARAENGPRMPLAIVRRSVQELGQGFVLDDHSAMSPEMKISGFKRAIVTARISATGDAMPVAGDLIGDSGPVPVGTHDLEIRIDRVVR